MKLLAPEYYKDFKCIADRCLHSCCVGWEIDVDDGTMEKYESLSEGYGAEILKSIDKEETPHFRLSENDRCPHLDGRGLCRIIADQVHAIIQQISPIVIDQETVGFSTADRIREMLDSGIYKKLDLSRVSMLLHMSKSNVIRIFKKQYGVTPYEYLLTAKMEAAKVMLTSTQMSVKDISDRLCITDEHYFSTLFQKRIGMRPSEYRKNTIK